MKFSDDDAPKSVSKSSFYCGGLCLHSNCTVCKLCKNNTHLENFCKTSKTFSNSKGKNPSFDFEDDDNPPNIVCFYFFEDVVE